MKSMRVFLKLSLEDLDHERNQTLSFLEETKEMSRDHYLRPKSGIFAREEEDEDSSFADDGSGFE